MIKEYVDSLMDSAKYYYFVNNPKDAAANINLPSDEVVWLKRIKRLEFVSFMPMLMALLTNKDKIAASDKKRILIDDESIRYDAIEFGKYNYSYGDKVYAIGNTSNYGIGISEGIISVPEVNVKYDNISRLVIQADINISFGNSGGALLNSKGQLIGITTFRTKDNYGNVNYGFTYSIPLKTIIRFIGEE